MSGTYLVIPTAFYGNDFESEQAPKEGGGLWRDKVSLRGLVWSTLSKKSQRRGRRTSRVNSVIGRGTSLRLAAEYSIAAFDHMGLFSGCL